MNKFIGKDFESLHLSTWTPIKDEEPPQSQIATTPRQSVSKMLRAPPHQTNKTPSETPIAGEVVRRIITAYKIARRAPKISLPRHASGAHEPLEEIEENPKPRANWAAVYKTDTLAHRTSAQARHLSTRAVLRRSWSPSPEDPAINSHPQACNRETTTRHFQQSPFQDTLAMEPVLFGNEPNAGNNTEDISAEGLNGTIGDKSIHNIYSAQGTLDDDSVVFIDSSGGDNESGVGDCSITSIDSKGSSMVSWR